MVAGGHGGPANVPVRVAAASSSSSVAGVPPTVVPPAADPSPAPTPATVATAPAAAGRPNPAAARSQERGEPLTLTLELDGGERDVTTTAVTVRGLLAEHDVVLEPDTALSHDLDAPLQAAMHLSARTPVAKTHARTAEVDFATEELPDPGLAQGTRITQTPGRTGTNLTTYVVQYVDGVEVARTQVMQVVQTPVIDEVVRVGTLDLPDSKKTVLTPNQARALAKSMLAERGWDAGQYTCLDKLWTRESNWRVKAANSSSGAYGIPQSLPGTKMGSVASDWRTNARTQISWGLKYVSGRYGTPCGAWSAFQSKGWY